MKSLKIVFTRTACMLLLVSLLHSFTATRAQVHPQSISVNESPASIRFVKTEGNMLVFEVHLTNLPAAGSKLRILDGDNNTLLEQKISTGVYDIRYKIVRGDISKINFEVWGKKIFLNQSFNVKSVVEEKIEVTRA